MDSACRGSSSAATPPGMAFNSNYTVMYGIRDLVRAANSGDSRSQVEMGSVHGMSALMLDLLEGAPADGAMVAARWAETLHFAERAAEQGDTSAQVMCAQIYAVGGRSVPQSWTTAVKWFRKAAAA